MARIVSASNRSVLYSIRPSNESPVSESTMVRSSFEVPVPSSRLPETLETCELPPESCRINITWNRGVRLASRSGASSATRPVKGQLGVRRRHPVHAPLPVAAESGSWLLGQTSSAAPAGSGSSQ